jgi:hypothetical protein
MRSGQPITAESRADGRASRRQVGPARVPSRWQTKCGHGVADRRRYRQGSCRHPTLRGWYSYFRHAHRFTFSSLDGFIRRRLQAMLRRQHPSRENCTPGSQGGDGAS